MEKDIKQKVVEKLANEDFMSIQDKFNDVKEMAVVILNEYENFLKTEEGKEYLKSLLGEEQKEQPKEEVKEEMKEQVKEEVKEQPKETQETEKKVDLDKIKEEVLKEIEAKKIIEENIKKLDDKYAPIFGDNYPKFKELVLRYAQAILDTTGEFYEFTDIADELIDVLKPIVEKGVGSKIEELAKQGSPPSGVGGSQLPGEGLSIEELRKSLGLPPTPPWKPPENREKK
jgi:hypothetical protein